MSITLHTQPNYGGSSSMTLSIGNFNWDYLKSSTILPLFRKNNALLFSSFKLDGAKVQLYKTNNFTGDFFSASSDISKLPDDFNNSIKSIRVLNIEKFTSNNNNNNNYYYLIFIIIIIIIINRK